MSQRLPGATRDANPDSPASETRWLALLVREGLVVIVRGIERRYGLRPYDQPRHETVREWHAPVDKSA